MFCEYYVKSGNAADGARRAGYSKSYAEHRTDEMLRNVEVVAYIKQLTEKSQKARIMTALQRQELLSDLARNDSVMSADRIRAIDTLNKMTGEYISQVTLSGDMGVQIIDDLNKT